MYDQMYTMHIKFYRYIDYLESQRKARLEKSLCK